MDGEQPATVLEDLLAAKGEYLGADARQPGAAVAAIPPGFRQLTG